MILFNFAFFIVGGSEFLYLLKKRLFKDTIIYTLLMILVYIFACFYYSNPIRPSLLEMIMK